GCRHPHAAAPLRPHRKQQASGGAGSRAPDARPPDACSGSYLISTFAPASSNFFLMASASSFETPSLIGFGALSTRSLASFSPRLVTSRTTLITLILLPPTSVSTTLNSVFSSAAAAGAAAPPPAATTTGAAAAADTPSSASSVFTS